MHNTYAFPTLAGHEYLSLKTFRRDGTPVPTPVWFAEEAGTLYITTQAGSGKTKRIRNFSTVEVAPCDQIGTLLGDWTRAQAVLLTEPEQRHHAHALLEARYGHTDMWRNLPPDHTDTRAFIKVTRSDDD